MGGISTQGQKLRWYIKHHTTGVVQTLLIPRIHETGTTTWETIIDKDEMNKFLVERNTYKFSLSNTLPFATGPIAEAIGQYGDNDMVEQILDGTINHATICLTHVDDDKVLDKVLICLQPAKILDRTPIHDTDDTIALEEYKNLFKKTREKTNLPPSNIHVCHYIVSCEYDMIAQVHLTMMTVPFRYGFTL